MSRTCLTGLRQSAPSLDFLLNSMGSMLPVLALALGSAVLASGCSCEGSLATTRGTACTTSAECGGGVCIDRRCRAAGGDAGAGGSCSSTPPRPAAELCNSADDDCDGLTDEGVLSECGNCDVTCRATGSGPGTSSPFDPVDHTDGSESSGVGLDPSGALVLDSRRVETAFIWIANTGQGTVSKVDTRTRMEVARYRTGPLAGGDNDPSRSSINSLGDAYIGNRGGRSVTKISVLGADCPDTNGDGVVRTSTGATDVLPWGQDDCVLWNTSVPDGGIIRALAAQDTRGLDGEVITAVWVGGWEGIVWKLDGETGGIVVRTASPSNNYGFALDGSGNLWISGRTDSVLGRIDTRRCVDTASCDVAPCAEDMCIKQRIPIPSGHDPYGITVDSAQRVWMAMYGSNTIGRYDPAAGASRWAFANVGVNCHGIAADAEGWIWAAGYDSGVIRLSADDPSMFAAVPGTGGRGSKGIAVDFDGRIWSINQGSEDATLIEPGPTLMDQMVTTEVVPQLVAPYTYSDMTGQQLRLATDPSGYYRRPYEGCDPAGGQTVWRELRFEGDAPPGTRFRFRVRTAATRAELPMAMWVLLGDSPPLTSPVSIEDALLAAGIGAQPFLEVEVQLEAMRSSATEIITPRLTAMSVTYGCGVF